MISRSQAGWTHLRLVLSGRKRDQRNLLRIMNMEWNFLKNLNNLLRGRNVHNLSREVEELQLCNKLKCSRLIIRNNLWSKKQFRWLSNSLQWAISAKQINWRRILRAFQRIKRIFLQKLQQHINWRTLHWNLLKFLMSNRKRTIKSRILSNSKCFLVLISLKQGLKSSKKTNHLLLQLKQSV